MLKWFSNEDGGTGPGGAPGSPQGAGGGGEAALGEVVDRLAQTELLVTQLKELIREKDGALHAKDELLKTEKEASEAKLSKMRLQNKAKVTSLTAKLDEMKKQQTSPNQSGQNTPTHSKKGGSETAEQASRGKILLLRKKVEELEHLLSQREEELGVKTLELGGQRQRGEEMDAMLVEKDRKLAEKESYIIHLQSGLAGEQPAAPPVTPAPEQKVSEDHGGLQDLQRLVQSLTRRVEEGEERCSLLQEQTESLRELLATEKHQYEEKENMYKQNIQTFKDIILQKDNMVMEVNQRHEQELFRLAAKSDASADLEQLLKALKQKLHEKEEVLLGKTQVIDVLQGEVDARDQQIQDVLERARRLQVERESLNSKLEAEKHVMRAQLRDLMEKHQAELRRSAEQHQVKLAEMEQALRSQLEVQERAPPNTGLPSARTTLEVGDGETPGEMDVVVAQRIAELEVKAKLKTEEASKSEAKFLKMKAWSKSRIRQLEDELRKNQSDSSAPDLSAMLSRMSDLEEEREEMLWKLDQYEEVKTQNGLLETKLVLYEEQQRKMQADLEQVTKRAASQASESGSADDTQSQVLEWQEMVSEAVTARDRAMQEKAAMVLRMSHMEEEREVLASRQQELEEELTQARGLGPHTAKKLGGPAPSSLQMDFEFDRQQSFQDQHSTSGNTTPMEGENMGEGLRSVVQELELERNLLQEQILALEERCQDLEDRLQLQTRIESLQNESERLQGQLAILRSQQSRDADKHQLLVTSLNKQLKGLSDTQDCLETSLIEKDNTLAKTSEKLELMDDLQDSLKEKEAQHKDVSEKLLQTGHDLAEVLKKCNTFEKQCSELKTSVADLTQKLIVLKEKTQKQEATIEALQTDLDQTNDELDKLNTTHLEERAQLIHDLQGCEREIDNLKDILLEKDKELSVLSGNMVEYAEQITLLQHEIKNKEEDLVRIESALTKAEYGAQISKDALDSDQLSLNARMAKLLEQLKDTEDELSKVKEEKECKLVEVEDLTKQVKVNMQTIQDLRVEVQGHNVSHHNHLSECETLISSLKEQVTLASQKLQKSEIQLAEKDASSETVKNQLQEKEHVYEKELKFLKEERNKLLAEVEKHKEDLQAMSKQLQEGVDCQEKARKTMQENLETITSLEEKVKITQEEAKGDRQKFSTNSQTRNTKMEQLEKELQGKNQNISKMKSLLKSLKMEKQQLETDLKGMTKELESQKQHVDELSDKLQASVEVKEDLVTQVNNFTEEKERLQLEVVERTKSISELSNERDSLLGKINAFETQRSEDVKISKGLQKEKEDLHMRVQELNKVLELNKQSVSEALLEKTNECTNLTKMLRASEEASEETVGLLRKQVENMNSEVKQLHLNMGEKGKTIVDLELQMEAQHGQQMQLQATLSLLQEQGTTLKSGLLEKDTSLKHKQEECNCLKSEVAQQKSLLSELQVVAETSKIECSQLSQLLQEREETLTRMTQESQNDKEELNKRNESVKMLNSQLDVMNKSATDRESENTKLKKTLEDHAAEMDKLRQEMEHGRVEGIGLHSQIKTLSEQHHQLETAYKIRDEELAQQKQVAFDLDRKVTGTLQQISDLSSQLNNLTQDNHKLQQELTQKTESEFELATERRLIHDKLAGLEMQHSENRMHIEVLLKDKIGLKEAADDLTKVLEQNKQSLLEKTNECGHLTRLFREREEAIASLQEQMYSMNIQIEQLNNNLADKDKTITHQCTQIERQQTQLVQLQETLDLHQEQVTGLKSGLIEKDSMLLRKAEECHSLQSEILLQKDQITKLQGEAESFRRQCSELGCRLEEKEETLRHTEQKYQNHKEEQDTTNESMKLLSNELDFMKANSAKLEKEVGELRATLENDVSKNDTLMQEMDQKQTEVAELKNKMQTLNKQKVRLKVDLQKSVNEAKRSLEEMSALRTEISNRDGQMCDLTGQLKAACADKESLSLSLQQKDDSLRQQETFIKQLQAKSEEVEGQKMEVVTELQTQAQSLQKSLQDREVSLHETERELVLLREKLCSNSEDFKTKLDSNAETITHLQGELTNLVDKNSKLTERCLEQEVQLKQNVDDNVKLEDSITQFRAQVDNLISESSLLKETLNEKEQVILQHKTKSSAVGKSLNSKLKAKESELSSLKEQLSTLQELDSQLNITLQTQTSEIIKLKETLEERDAAIVDQSKALQDMHRKTDEVALFKAQFMETTELVSQLQSQIQVLSTGSANLSMSVEEKQSAFDNLQEMYAAHSEELREVRKELSQRTQDISSLNEALGDRSTALEAAEVNGRALKTESLLLLQEIQQLKTINSNISKQHEDALASHQTSTSSLTAETERLKSQYSHTAAQVNALTENLDHRERDLHAINSQYTAQLKHTEHLVSEIQRLEEQNRDLGETLRSIQQEHQQDVDATLKEKAKLEKEVQRLVTERGDAARSHSHKIQAIKEQMQQQSSSMNEVSEKMIAEKQELQFEVSVSNEKIAKLQSVIQDSEKEWRSVLERETQDKNLLVNQLKMVENEMESKDFKVQALKQDLDSLHEKLAEAASAIRQGSDQLKEKEVEASASRVQLQKILASVLEKERENVNLKQALQVMENEARKLKGTKERSDKDLSVLTQTMSERVVVLEQENISSQTKVKQLQESHQSELNSLKGQLHTVCELHRKAELTLKEMEQMYHGESQQKLLLQEQVQHMQTQLQIESENMKDSAIKLSALIGEIQTRDDQISCMTIQLSQQKELFAGLSQQLREKDGSVAVFMESVSNERMKNAEEKNTLKSQLENLESAHISSVKQLESMLLQLDESRSQIETKNFENGELAKVNDNIKAQLNKLSKEKDAMKKKLQAALVVRKDLLRKIDEHESQKEVNVRNEVELLAAQNELQTLNSQAQVTAEEHEAHMNHLKQQILQKDGELLELAQELSTSGNCVEQLGSNWKTLQTKLDEQELCLTSTRHTLNEKSAIVDQLYCSMTEQKEAFEHDRYEMRIQFDELQDEMKKQEDIYKQELSTSVTVANDYEKEIAIVKQEHVTLQNKAQAASLAQLDTIKKSQENEKKLNQELSKLQNDFKDLLEKHCQQTNELDAIQLKFNQKAKELEDIQKRSSSNLNDFDTPKKRENTLVTSHTLVTEREEQQLQQRIHPHEVGIENVRTESEVLQQKCVEDTSKSKDQDSQIKTATKKLQAALISRREVLKENRVLKEQLETFSAKSKEIEASYSALEISVTNLKQQNLHLENSVLSLSNKKEELVAEINSILSDNHNLSAACESLKLTIESITQQKQAFSFQLESLKDSQTEELSEWKSKHKELRQQYDSLLQAYDNVSGDVDKLRQLLEGARKEKEDALSKAHTLESERESLERRIREMKKENEEMRENMERFVRTKEQKIEELEKENQNIQKDLKLFEDKQKAVVEEWTTRNHQLEDEIHSLKESSEVLRERLAEVHLENGSLAEKLEEASCSLEKCNIESRTNENSIKLDLDEALNLNNSLTAQIETQKKEQAAQLETQKKELAAQLEMYELILKENTNISERNKHMQNEHVEELGKKEAERQELISRHSQETLILNEKVKILEDDKCLLQEELENAQEISDKVKNENEYLETMILKNSERLEQLTESVSGLQAQNTHLSSQLTTSKEEEARVCQEKEEQELKLVKEFEEKLKMVQRGNEGSKNLKKELQELLKDKHHEIIQLQRDCIQYQELISDLEKSLSTSQSAHEVLERELKGMAHSICNEVERRKQLEKELVTSTAKDILLAELTEKNKDSEFQLLERIQAIDSVVKQYTSVGQFIRHKQTDEQQRSKNTESKIVVELKQQSESQDLQIASLSGSTQDNVDGDLNATNSLKHEIRTLLHQMDDLNSENAMLKAQLIRYREDLNQVLLLKDHQLKDLLKKQQDTITNLENQKATTEMLHKESLLEGMKSQNMSLNNAMAALQNDRDQLIEDFKMMQSRYDDELIESRAALNKVERCLEDATSELATLSQERHILVEKLSALKNKDAHSQLTKLVDELSEALSKKEGELKRLSLENGAYSRQVSAFSGSMASIQGDRDRLMHELMVARRHEYKQHDQSLGAVNSNSPRGSIDTVHTERDGLDIRKKLDELQRELQQEQSYRLQAEAEVNRYQTQLATLRSEQTSLHVECQARERTDYHPIKESMALVGSVTSEGTTVKLQSETVQLQRDLQRCLYEIQQRDLHCQQLNTKLQQAVEEKGSVTAQLRVLSQTLRDTQLNLGQLQNRCYWLESQGQAPPHQSLQGAVAPGAPQERSSAVAVIDMDTMEAVELRAKLVEVEQSVLQLNERLAEERAGREAAEEALGLVERRHESVESSPSRSTQRDFSIQLETEEEWQALILNPNEPLVTRKVKGGVLACRRWLRGRSLYCSKLMTSRGRARYFFLAYLLTLHIAVLMCLTGAL